MPQFTASDRIGTTVGGRYEVKRLLGEGGFSSVFEAIHNITGRSIALKLLHPHLVTTEQITERFLLEARAMARIRHDGIVQVLDAGKDDDDTVFIALELLEGEALESTLQRARSISWGETVAIGIDVLRALAEAHRNKIIHRDIKPGNIFITRKPGGGTQAKLLDFGIAHVAQAKGKFTQQGVILGTPEYMSPEQARAGTVGPEADLWSVGIVLFECIVGETPFMSENTTEILLRVQTETAPELHSVIPSVPLSVSAVVRRALERDVANRYHSADEMREELERAVAAADQARVPANRSVFRGTTAERRVPAATVAENPSSLEAPKVEMVRVGSSLNPSPLTPTAPTRPAKATVGAKPSARAVPEAPKAKNEAVQVIRPGRMVVEEVVATSRYDDRAGGEARNSRAASEARDSRTASEAEASSSPKRPERPERPEPKAPRSSKAEFGLDAPARPADEFALDRERFTLDPPLPAPSADSRAAGDVFETPALAPSPRLKQQFELEPKREPATRVSAPDTLSTFTSSARGSGGHKTPAAFNAPPRVQRSGLLIAGGIAAVVIGGIALAAMLRPSGTGDANTTTRNGTSDASTPAARTDAGGASETPPSAVNPRLRLQPTHEIATPIGGDSSEFARHSAASRGDSLTTQRVIASCMRSGEGNPTVYFHPLLRGDALGSTRAAIACAGFDLGVVNDVTGDGTDDVVAVGAGHNGLVLFNSASRQVAREFPLVGARGLAVGGGFTVDGETFAVVYTEPAGDEQPGTVVALGLRSGQTRWRQSGSGNLGRYGQPVELGLAVGPDVNRDGVADVVVGLGTIIGRGGESAPQRCVQVLSGATGEALWSPRCRGRGRGSQSVSLGPDVNGDGVPDVAVAADRPDRDEPGVELRSGTDGTEIRTITLPQEINSLGFGWPVALLGPVAEGQPPILAVGSVAGSAAGLFLFDARSGALDGRLELPGVGAATLRLFPVLGNTRTAPWSLVVGTPNEGIKAFAIQSLRDDES